MFYIGEKNVREIEECTFKNVNRRDPLVGRRFDPQYKLKFCVTWHYP